MSRVTIWTPSTDAERNLVRQQMNRLLETHHFKNSRRYPALFRFIVEETLEGRGEFLKERLLGIQVFGRHAGYDTASDPIVRVTVAEIRKRIAQYYHDEAHALEMRIELLPGNYEPEFRPSRQVLETEQTSDATRSLANSSAPVVLIVDSQEPVHEPVHARESARPEFASDSNIAASYSLRISVVLMSLLVCALACAGTYAWRANHPSAIDEFWDPVTASNRTVLLCLGVAGGKFGPAADSMNAENGRMNRPPVSAPSQSATTTYLGLESIGENVVFADVQALARISDTIAMHNGKPRLLLNSSVHLDDLRQGPSVLIGALDNQWTLRAIDQMRYRFAGNSAESYWITDSRTGKPTPWGVDIEVPVNSVKHDYAIVARLRDQATGQIEVLIAGIGMTGTAAGSELLSNPSLIDQLRKQVGPGFRDRSFEAVISTDVVDGSSGPPKILTVDVQ